MIGIERWLGKKRVIVYLVLLLFSFISLGVSQDSGANVMKCGIYKKGDVPADYQPIASFLVNPADVVDGKIGNAHIANYSSSYEYGLYCSAFSYGDVGGVILDRGVSCYSRGMMEVVNTSGVDNAHVQDPQCSDEGCSPSYDYQLCMFPKNYNMYSTILCEVKDSCDEDETCLFKFSGQQYTYTNAHVYDCEYPNLPTNTKSVCCIYTVSSFTKPLIRTINPFETSETQDVYVPLGITTYLSVTLFNPTQKPQLLDIYASSDEDEDSKLFLNFVWFEDETKRFSSDPRHVQILLAPMEKKALTLNIFGGKVGEYNLYISRKTEDGAEERVATYKVYIIPSSGKATQGSAPEFPEWGYFLILIGSSAIILWQLNKKLGINKVS